VDAPINAGSVAQTKAGSLTVNFSGVDPVGLKVLGKMQMVDGAQGAGKALVSDANGIGSWQTIPGAYYFTPVIVYNLSDIAFPDKAPGVSGAGTVGWTTFDASPYIPVGSSAVILESVFALSGPDNGFNSVVYTRANSSGSSVIAAFGRCAGSGDNCGGGMQATVPVSSSRTFDYYIATGFNRGLRVRLIGYIGPAISNLTTGTLSCTKSTSGTNTVYTFAGAPTGGNSSTYSYNFHMNIDPGDWPINSTTNVPGSLSFSNSSYSNQHWQRLDVSSANSTVSTSCI
jgi:hypothetical protein